MKKLNKVVTVLAKIAEVCCWVACGFMAACILVVAIGKPEWLRYLGDFKYTGILQLDAFGFSVTAGEHIQGVYLFFFVVTLLSTGLWAMIFRNIHLIFETAAGKTKFSKGETPFQPDNVRMLREIGIFMIAVPVVQMIISVIMGLCYSHDLVDTAVSFNGVFTGLVVLCLSQFFAYGTQLQDETDGLL